MFEDGISKVKVDFEQIVAAMQSLQMEVGNSDALAPWLEEMQNLRNVRSEISTVYAKVENLRDAPWQAVQPKKIRAQLDYFLTSLQKMRSKLRQ